MKNTKIGKTDFNEQLNVSDVCLSSTQPIDSRSIVTDSSQNTHSFVIDVRKETMTRKAGFKESVFAAVAAALDTGTIAFPYVIMMNGYIFGSLLVCLGAYMSYNCSMLLVKVCEKTKGETYEDIAMAVYGKRAARITSVINIFSLMAFTTSFIVFMKEAIPLLIWRQFRNKLDQLPHWILDNHDGHLFWGTVFAFGILFPLALARDLNQIRFTNQLGVVCNLYLCVVVMMEFFTNEAIIPDPIGNLKKIEAFKFSLNGVVNSFPLIMFSYMQQIGVSMIYTELKGCTYEKMSRVVGTGTIFVTTFYLMIGFFGYAIFLGPPESH